MYVVIVMHCFNLTNISLPMASRTCGLCGRPTF